MAVRKTLNWMFVFVALAVMGGGGYAYWLYTRSDEFLEQAILDALHEKAPNCWFTLESAHFDWNRRVRIYDLRVGAAGDERAVVELPEAVLVVDRELLRERQQVDVLSVRLSDPVVRLERSPAGRWNWEDLLPIEPMKRRISLPECELDDATVHVVLGETGGRERREHVVDHVDLRLIPSGMRQFRFDGRAVADRAGTIEVQGQVDVERRSWSVEGDMQDVPGGHDLLALIASASPELREKLQHAAARLKTFDVRRKAAAGRKADAPREGAVPDFGVSGILDVEFQVAQARPTAEPEFEIQLDVRDGRIDNPLLPFTLHDVKGHVHWTNGALRLRDFSARNGVTAVRLGGAVQRQGGISPAHVDLEVDDLPFDQRVRERLPGVLGEVNDTFNPTGRADLRVSLDYDGRGAWTPSRLILTARDCTVTYDEFPYRVTDVTATLQRTPRGDLEARLRGKAGRAPLVLRGVIHDPGPAASAAFEVTVEGLPIDETFVSACPPGLQRTLESLNLSGVASGVIELRRPAGLDQPWQRTTRAKLTRGSLEYEHFPYRLTDFSGDVVVSSQDGVWQFRNLVGRHDSATVTGTGTFHEGEGDEPDRLKMSLAARGAVFDKQLEMALPESLQDAWKSLNPRGRLDLDANVGWVAGEPVDVRMPRVVVTGGETTMSFFPYPLEDLHGTFSYADGRVEIKELTAQHERARFSATGFFESDPRIGWRLRLNEIFADDLSIDRSLRRALPRSLRDVAEALDPQRPLSASGRVEFRGTGRDDGVVTSAWDVETVLAGNRVTAGVFLENVHGRVTLSGTYDGRSVTADGDLDLESLAVFGYQFTEVRGPLRIRGSQLTVGADEAFAEAPGPIPLENRITARAIGGAWTLDAIAVFNREVSYRVKTSLSDGRLEEYARRYLPGAKNLAGRMVGWLDLHGRGTEAGNVVGRGQLQIAPAALYELPLFVQIFNVLGNALLFAPPDNTAFEYAFLDFGIAREKFVFDRILLEGRSVSFLGRGEAEFGGSLDLNLYSQLARNQRAIPIFNLVVGEAARGWVAIDVDGDVDRPMVDVRNGASLDNAIRTILATLGGRPPQLMAPPGLPENGMRRVPTARRPDSAMRR